MTPSPQATIGEPAPGNRCRLCSEPLEDGALRCTHCGAVHGPLHRCPHCGAVADVDKGTRLRFLCRVCGGPRIPNEGSQPRGNDENVHLVTARQARHAMLVWRLTAAVVASFGLLGLVVALLLLSVFTLPKALIALLIVAVSVPLVVAFWAWRRAIARKTQVSDALDAAWAAAVSATLAQVAAQGAGGELSAAELGRRLRIDEGLADQLLTRLGVADRVRLRVTEAGELLYSTQAMSGVELEGHLAEQRAATERSSRSRN